MSVIFYNLICMSKRRHIFVDYSQMVIGTIVGVGKKHLEVKIPNEHKLGYCRLSDTTDFIKGNFNYYFYVGQELPFVLKKKNSISNRIFLNYMYLHPEEMKFKGRPISTVSYHLNLQKNLKVWMQNYKFKYIKPQA